MQSLSETLKSISAKRNDWTNVVPDDAQCTVCGYFNIAHPEVAEAILQRVQAGDKSFGQRIQCKCAAREAERQALEQRRRDDANLPHERLEHRTFGNFEPVAGTEEMVVAAKEFVERKGPLVLVFLGGVGAGKSHLLEAVGRAVLDQGRSVRYELVSSMLDRLRHTFHPEVKEDIQSWLSWYETRYLMILDDLGMEKSTDWTIDKVTTLLDGRMRDGQPTLIATNKNEAQLQEMVGDRLTSRLYATNRDLHDVRLVVTTAKDYRR